MSMRREWFLVALLLTASTLLAYGQPALRDRVVKAAPGQNLRVGIYTSIRPDCTSGPLPAIRLARAPAHGAVTVKRAMLKATNIKQCLAIDVPAFVAFYRAAPDFSGADEFDLEVTFANGRKELQHFRVSAAGAASGQKI